MTGLLALLDDVAAISRVAASTLDDIVGAAAEAGSKTAGVVIDDAAVTPKYVHGFEPARELPIIWKIARGSLFNKLLILTPAAVLLATFAPWLLTPLLMLGGSFLCFEGAEKVLHAVYPHDPHVEKQLKVKDPGKLEEAKVKGAIKTDFILSAEIMTISMSSLPADQPVWIQAGALALIAVAVTVGIYGTVGLIVKMDDVGLYLVRRHPTGPLRALGKGLVQGMPLLMKVLAVVGTAAMLWVGGQIIVHGLHDLGVHHPYEDIHHLAEWAAHAGPPALSGSLEWLVTALCDGLIGIAYGMLLIPVVTRGLVPLLERAGLVKAH
jgi:hypothetical protein